MTLNSNIVEELELLSLFNLDSTQEGIKIHHEADPARIAAGQRLFDKGMITLMDGGYLTKQGHAAAEHTHAVINLLKS